MGTYIMFGKYTPEVMKSISAERTSQAQKLVELCGGRLTALYATLGEYDIIGIAEFPELADAMKASVALNRATGIHFLTAPAISADDFDKLCGC